MISLLNPDYAREQYEALRREAIDTGALGRRGHGLSLFLTRGMPAWLTALATLTPRRTESADSQQEHLPSERSPVLPSCARSEWTVVLADMVLACSQGGAQ